MAEDPLARLLVPGTDRDTIALYAGLAERAESTPFGFEDELAFVDIETTGLNPASDLIVEVAAVITRGPEIVERHSTLVDPGVPIPLETTTLTGIDDDAVRGAPDVREAVARLAEAVGGRDVVGHNVSFEKTFLSAVAAPQVFPGEWVDSLQLARIALPRLRSHRLHDLAAAFGAGRPAHRAAADVEALARLWRVMLCALDGLPAEVLAGIAAASPATSWPLRRILSHMAAGRPAAPLDLRVLRSERIGEARGEAMLDALEVETRCPGAEEVLADLSSSGAVAAMFQAFERREEQERMAEAVAHAFGGDTHLAVEAGTGVGKSLAYLLPAARFAMANKVGVGVATKTNSLADQLAFGELPALSQALGGDLTFVSLKGYDNYLCLRRLERMLKRADLAEDTLALAGALVAWTAQTSWADLGALNVHWTRDARAALRCSVSECVRTHCRFYRDRCFVHGLRQRAGSAHIVVTNHALLFRDLVSDRGILPPLRHWIIDEAHSAEAEARAQLSLSASHSDLNGTFASLVGDGRGGVLAAVRAAVRGREDKASLLRLADEMEEALGTGRKLAESMFDYVKDLAQDRPDDGYHRVELRLTSQLRDGAGWSSAAGVGRSLARCLDGALQRGRALVTALELEGMGTGEVRADLVGGLSRLAEQLEALGHVLDGEDDSYVYRVALDRRREVTAERLEALPLDVGDILVEHFYPGVRSVVFTSATLVPGDDFAHFARAVGLDRLPDTVWRGLRLQSSYALDQQMTVFVPADVAPPNSPSYIGQLERMLAEVHLAMGGSVLTLFTNRKDMEAVHSRLAPVLWREGLGLLVQRDSMSARRLAEEFLADEKLSLFATKSFWEGFDARGDTLRCVVVTRLPFGQTTDPLLEERRERDRDWWEHYYLPEALIELRQAAGRLIRSATDTGCVVIADTRVIGDKPYAKRFLRALPVPDVEVLPTDEMVEEISRRFGRRQ